MTVLIPAVTGRVASELARWLVAAGVPVRALARDRDRAVAALAQDGPADSRLVDLRIGALDDPIFLAGALRGVDAAFLSVGTGPHQTALERGFIDAAHSADLPHLMKLSTVDIGADSPNPVGRWHAEIEEHLAASGIPATVLRAAYFATNLLRTAAPSVASGGRWFGTAPAGRIAMIDPVDVAAAAAAIILDGAGGSGVHELTGPTAVSLPDVADILSDLLDVPVSYVPTTTDAMRAALSGRGVPGFYIDVVLGIDAGVESGLQERVTDTVEKLTGEAPTPPDRFLRQHLDVFRPTRAAGSPA